jgi:hypothetical protein
VLPQSRVVSEGVALQACAGGDLQPIQRQMHLGPNTVRFEIEISDAGIRCAPTMRRNQHDPSCERDAQKDRHV